MNSFKAKFLTVVAVAGIAGAAYVIGATGAPSPRVVSAAPVLYSADTVSTVYANASPAIVEIDVSGGGSGRYSSMVQGQGSGFLIDNQGHILTNNHVVEGAGTVTIVLANGNTVPATVAGTDAIDDLAVVTIDPLAMKTVTPLQLVDSGTIKPGQMAIAIGTPFGLNNSVSVGIISGLNRSVSGSNLNGMLQTDAAINPGNSGGPLLDVNGMVMGINTAIEGQGSDGIGFAIPSNIAKNVIPTLVSGKTVTKPWLGISGIQLTQTLAGSLNLTVNEGVYVVTVVSGSPADKAGLKAGGTGTNGTPGTGGDVITAVDGNAVKTVPDISNYLNTKNVGDSVTLTVLRGGSSIQVKVTLEARPDSVTTLQTQPQIPSIPRIPGHGFGRGN